MSLLIGLQAPVLGFCQHSQTFFLTSPECVEEPPVHDCHDCTHHHEEPAESPCDDCHHFVSLDIDDFFWATDSSQKAPLKSLITPDFGPSPAPAALGKMMTSPDAPRPPPPPGTPLFRLHSVIRR
ncbi:MAG: hypothetical protein ACSHYF_13430 [Verrucomicrobiaceae bacterium]